MSGLSRWFRYLRTNGPTATMRRVLVGLKQLGHAGNHVIFSCDLPVANTEEKDPLVIEQLVAEDRAKMQRILTHWDESTMAREVGLRFRLGAQLWLAKVNSELVAYGWTLRGRTAHPYFFPLCPSDVHFFDFVVFPEFRGARINPRLVAAILSRLGRDGERRAYIECAAWNEAQLRSLARTPFRKIALGRKIAFLGSFITAWSPVEPGA